MRNLVCYDAVMDTHDTDPMVVRLGEARRDRIESTRHNPKRWARAWTDTETNALGIGRVNELKQFGGWTDQDVALIGALLYSELLNTPNWTTQEVADWYGVKDRTVYQWFQRRKVTPSKFGSANCYPRHVAMSIEPKPKGRRPRPDATA